MAIIGKKSKKYLEGAGGLFIFDQSFSQNKAQGLALIF